MAIRFRMLKTFQGEFDGSPYLPMSERKEYEVGDTVGSPITNKLVLWLHDFHFIEFLSDSDDNLEDEVDIVAVGEETEEEDVEVVAVGDEIMTSENQWNPSLPTNATQPALDFAASNNIDLATVEGSGAGGRITLSDVKKVVEEK